MGDHQLDHFRPLCRMGRELDSRRKRSRCFSRHCVRHYRRACWRVPLGLGFWQRHRRFRSQKHHHRNYRINHSIVGLSRGYGASHYMIHRKPSRMNAALLRTCTARQPAGDLPHARNCARRVRNAVEEKPAGRFIIRNRTRVVNRHPDGDW